MPILGLDVCPFKAMNRPGPTETLFEGILIGKKESKKETVLKF